MARVDPDAFQTARTKNPETCCHRSQGILSSGGGQPPLTPVHRRSLIKSAITFASHLSDEIQYYYFVLLGFYLFLDPIESILPPKQLIVNDESRRAKDACFDRLLGSAVIGLGNVVLLRSVHDAFCVKAFRL